MKRPSPGLLARLSEILGPEYDRKAVERLAPVLAGNIDAHPNTVRSLARSLISDPAPKAMAAELEEIAATLGDEMERETLDELRVAASLDGAPEALRRMLTEPARWHSLLLDVRRAVDAQTVNLSHGYVAGFAATRMAMFKVAGVAARAAVLAALAPERDGGRAGADTTNRKKSAKAKAKYKIIRGIWHCEEMQKLPSDAARYRAMSDNDEENNGRPLSTRKRYKCMAGKPGWPVATIKRALAAKG